MRDCCAFVSGQSFLRVALGIALFSATLGATRAEPSSDHIRLSSEFLAKGDLAAAEKHANLGLATPSTRPLAYAALGAIRLNQGNYEESENFLKKAVQLEPRLLGARLNLGSVYVLQGKTDLAAGVFRQVLKLDPANAMARLNLAQMESEKGRYRVSLELVQPILTGLRQTPDGLLLLATNYLGLGDVISARRLVTAWNKLSSEGGLASSFGVLLARNNLNDEAIQVLEAAKKKQGSYELAFNLANCYFKKGDGKQASANYEVALTYNEGCVDCLLQLGRIADQEGNVEKALAFMILAKRKSSDDPEVLFEFGKICLKKDLYQDATKALERAVELKPGQDSYLYVLASARVGTKRFEEARSILEKLLSKKPNDFQLNYAMGAVFYLEAKLDEAADYFKRSIELQPDQLAAHYYLASVAQNKGDHAGASQMFQELLNRHPDHGPSHEALGAVLLQMGKYVEAEQHLEKAIALAPDSVRAHYQLSLLYARMGKKMESDQQMDIFKKLKEQEKEEMKELILLTPN
jgi:tetratricopeptide (TPR) repeat protein